MAQRASRSHDRRAALAQAGRVALVIVVVPLFALHAADVFAQTPGLIAAYAFDEGAGTVAADASGNGNTGVVSGATWRSAGRFGSALAFNGTDSRVTASSVALGPAFSLMAWVSDPTPTPFETIVTI